MSMRSIRSGRRAVLGALLVGALAGSIALPAVASAAPRYRVVDLGLGDDSVAYSLNESGHVVGSSAKGAFLWRDGVITYLLPPGVGGRALDVNNRDEVVGFRIVGRSTRPFLWRNGVVTELDSLPGGTATPVAINDRGEIVGTSSTRQGTSHAVRWRDEKLTDLGVLPGECCSTAFDINNAGVVVGDSFTFGSKPLRWSADNEMEQLSDVESAGVAINEFGAIAGQVYIGQPHGFLWLSGEYIELQPPSWATFAQPHGINDRVQIVGNTDFAGYLWENGQFYELPKLVGTSAANDINNKGQIVGLSATKPDGTVERAVLWTPDSSSGS